MTYHDEPHHAMIYHAVQMNWLYGFAFQGARSVGKQHGYTVHGSAFTIVLQPRREFRGPRWRQYR